MHRFESRFLIVLYRQSGVDVGVVEHVKRKRNDLEGRGHDCRRAVAKYAWNKRDNRKKCRKGKKGLEN
jgi:hypothetical protein